jgi:hypothetical protein
VRIVRNSGSTSGKYINVDAVLVTGALTTNTLVQQTDSRVVWTPYYSAWTTGTTSYASGGDYKYINKAGSVTINFTGVSLSILAKKAPSYGIAKITLDGTKVYSVNLYRSTTA